MRHVTLELGATGTPLDAIFMFAPFGHGAHGQTNSGTSLGARNRIGWGMPADSFMAPSEQLVVTRFGVTHDPRQATRQIAELVGATVSARHAEAQHCRASLPEMSPCSLRPRTRFPSEVCGVALDQAADRRSKSDSTRGVPVWGVLQHPSAVEKRTPEATV